uniref:Uncharacterized protein n=1 Tax=Arundo donax TaxID=35708 RepID=A0A0A9A2W7_ARUDO
MAWMERCTRCHLAEPAGHQLLCRREESSGRHRQSAA